MFTGIIEEIGTVTTVVHKGKSLTASVATKRAFSDLALGDSVSVDGVCLTITNISRNTFSVDISEETVKTSSMSQLKIGQKVNLERALTLNKRLGGHLVSGHIDGIAEMRGKIARDEGYELLFKVSRNLLRYIVPKGSVALDGVSLTVNKVSNDGFSLMIIPHTAQYTTLGQKQIGDKLNIEGDLVSKYLEGLFGKDTVTPVEKVIIDSGFLPIGIIEN